LGAASSCACLLALLGFLYLHGVAQAPTLYDFEVALSHVDRGLQETLSVRTARHPSETLERVFLRVLTYCFFREERLAFGKGLSDPESPDLEARDLTGLLSLWIRVGKAEPSRVQKVADQSSRARVAVVFESPQRMEEFLAAAQKEKLSRLGRVELLAMDPALAAGLAEKDERRHRLGVTIVGEHFYVEQGKRSFDGPLSRGSAP
jgi:uncharacterized protein YaeQ